MSPLFSRPTAERHSRRGAGPIRLVSDLRRRLIARLPSWGGRRIYYRRLALSHERTGQRSTDRSLLLIATLSLAALAVAALFGMGRLSPASAITCPASLSYGDTIDCSISVGGEVDEYTFSGASGERVVARMVKTSGSLWSQVKILRPDDTVLCSTTGFTLAEINTCLLDATGTHSVTASDRFGSGTGDYNLHLQRTNPPAGATSISYDELLSGETTLAAELDAFTLDATSGDQVVARFGKASGILYPKIWIYRPDGTLKCAATNSKVAQLDTCALDVTGEHSILVGDRYGNRVGQHLIHAQRTNSPVNPVAISFGETVSGVIDTVEVDAYTFTASSGDIIFARMADNSSVLQPQIKIYRPDGTLICSVGFASYGGSVANDCTLDATGQHTLLTRDFSGVEGGSYGLYIQRPTNPTGAIGFAFNETRSGNVSTMGEMDTYSVDADGGDWIFLRTIVASGTPQIDPWQRLYDTTGSPQCDQAQYGLYVLYNCQVSGSGTRSLLIGDFSGPNTGSYYSYMQRTNDPVGAFPISYGSSTNASISAGQMQPFSFSGRSGDGIVADLDVSPDNLTSAIRIFRPDGTSLCDNASWGDTVTLECTLDVTGTYLILAGTFNSPSAASFVLELNAAPPVHDPDHPTSDWDHHNEDDGDPVNVATGSFRHAHTDIAIPGTGVPLSFTRYYNSGSSVNRSLGEGWTHNYDMYLEFPSGGVKVFYADGHAVTFTLSGGVYVPPARVFDKLVKNGDGTYTLTNPSQIEYNFSSSGRLDSMEDRNGNTTSLTYTGSLLTSVTDSGGRSLTLSHDGSNRIQTVSDPLPSPDTRTVEFTYDGSGDLTQVDDVKGGTTVYTYVSHRMTSLTDSNGHLANESIYDSAQRVAEQEDATGGVTCFYYGVGPTYTSAQCPSPSPAPVGNQTIVVDPRGNRTIYTHDSEFRSDTIEDDLGGTVQFTYDGDSNVSCITDQLGNKIGFAYDSNGKVTQIIDAANTDATCALKPGGVDWNFTYTTLNDIDTETDALDRVTDYDYDGSGNLTQVLGKDDLGSTVSRTCLTRDSGTGQVTEVIQSTTLTDCTGNKTKLEYDTYGNPTAVIDPRFSGQPTPPKTTFTYDLGGRTLTVTNELSHTATATYDAQNNVLTAADNLGNTSSNTYDAKGNLTSVTDANREAVGPAESGAECGTAGTGDGVDDDSDTVADDGCPSAIYNYDDGDRLTEIIDALGQSTTYSYDENGNLTSVTDANRQPVGPPETACGTAGTGDGVDDDSDGTKDDGCPSTIHVYDSLNRSTSETDALGRVTSYTYDVASQLKQRTDARGLVTKYFPDVLGRLDLLEHWDVTLVDSVDYTYNAVGNRTVMVDDTGTTNYGYDALSRITCLGSSAIATPCPSGNTAYEYDNVGARSKITYPDGKTVSYAYDVANNLKTVTDWLSNVTSYTYDDAGKLTKTTLPNGVWSDFGYDTADRLTSVFNEKTGPVTISSFTYTLDAAGNRTQMVDTSGTNAYDYDELYRLTDVTYPGPTTDTYTYDAVGNRLTKNTDDYTYDAANQLTDLEGLTYGYDANGNQTTRGSDTFTYDHENRLTQTVLGGVTSSSTYNGDGVRMSHTVGPTTTDYEWDVARRLPVVLDDGTKTYVYGLDLISATDGAGVETYFTHDGLGSTADLTDDTGAVTDTYSYDVFGAIRSQTGSSDNDWLFTGEQRDGDSDLYFLRARYYDPSTGRFLSRDPIGGAEPYAYVSNNPCSNVDPTGLASESTGGFRCQAEYDIKGIGRHPGNICLPFVGCTPNIEWFPSDLLAQLDANVTFTVDGEDVSAEVTKIDPDTPWLAGWILGPGWKTDGWQTFTSASGDLVIAEGFFHRLGIQAEIRLVFKYDPIGGATVSGSHLLTGNFGKTFLAGSFKGSCDPF